MWLIKHSAYYSCVDRDVTFFSIEKSPRGWFSIIFYFSLLSIVLRKLFVEVPHMQKGAQIASIQLDEFSQREYTHTTNGLTKN